MRLCRSRVKINRATTFVRSPIDSGLSLSDCESFGVFLFAVGSALVLLPIGNGVASTLDFNFTIGYLATDQVTSYAQQTQGRVISGAITCAVVGINADADVLTGHQLSFVWADTQSDTLKATASMSEQWRNGAIAFFGLEDSCDVEARVAAAWNLPIISYVRIFCV